MIGFREISEDDAKMILNWRTSTRVTQFMGSDIEYNLQNQIDWIKATECREDYYPWIITVYEKPIGLVYVENLNIQKKETHWGFYIGDDEALGLGGFVPSYFYNFAFDMLGVQKINADVFYNNINVIELHLKQGYEFFPENDHLIVKNGRSILLVSMRLEKDVFKKSRLAKLKTKFPIKQWKACPIREQKID